MGVRESSSAFTYHVLKNIDQEVINSLTKDQLKAIYEGISASKPYEKHLVDIRGIIPLFFCRLYFVVLAGQDIRPKIRSQDELRRSNADVLINTVVMMFLKLGLLRKQNLGFLWLLGNMVDILELGNLVLLRIIK